MAILQDIVQARLEIDGKAAVNELAKLQIEAKELRNSLKDMSRGSSDFAKSLKQAEKELNSLDREAKRLENDLKNTFDPNQIQAYQQAIIDNSRAIEKAKDKINELKAANNEYVTASKKLESVEQQAKELTAQLGYAGLSMRQLLTEQRALQSQFNTALQGTAQYEELGQKLGEIGKELKARRADLAEFGQEFAHLDRRIELNTLSLEELQTEHKNLMAQFKKTSSASADYQELRTRIKAVGQAIRDTEDDLRENRTQWQRWGDGVKSLLRSSFDDLFSEAIMSMIAFMGQMIQSAKDGAIKMADELTNIQKKIKGSTVETVMSLNKELGQIDTRTGNSELREMAGSLAALGVSAKDLPKTVEAMNTSFLPNQQEISSIKEFTQQFGAMKNSFKEVQNMNFDEYLLRVSSAGAKMSDSFSTDMNKLNEFTSMAGTAAIKPLIHETMALGAILTETLNPKIAASGFKEIMNKSAIETKAFADQLGITKKEFEQLVLKSPNDMILKLLDSFKNLNEIQTVQALEKMNIKNQEAAAVMNILKNRITDVTNAEKSSLEEFNKMTLSAQNAAMYEENYAGRLAKAEKDRNSAMAAFNQFLADSYLSAVEGTTKFLLILKAIPGFISENRRLLMLLAGALIILKAETIAASLASLKKIATDKLLIISNTATSFSFRGFAAAARTAWAALGGPLVLIPLLLPLFDLLYEKMMQNEKFAQAMGGTWNALKAVFNDWADLFVNQLMIAFDLLSALMSLLNGDFSAAWDKAAGAAERWKNTIVGSFNMVAKATFLANEEGGYGKAFTDGEKEAGKTYSEKKLKDLGMEGDQTAYEGNAYQADGIYVSEAEKRKQGQHPQTNPKSPTPATSSLASMSDEEVKEMKKREQEAQKHKKALEQIERDYLDFLAQIEAQKDELYLSEEEKELKAIDKKYIDIREKIKENSQKIKESEEIGKAEKFARIKGYQAEEAQINELWFAERLKKQQEQWRKEAEKQAEWQKETDDFLKNLQEEAKAEEEKNKADDRAQSQEIFLAAMPDQQRELLEAAAKYERLRELAVKYGEDITHIEKAYKAEVEKINQSAADKEVQMVEKKFKAVSAFSTSFGQIMTAAYQLAGTQAEEMAAFNKGMTLFQIAIDTASAISAMTAKGALTSLDPITAAIKIAAGIAVVIGNMAKAKQVLSGADKPAKPKLDSGGTVTNAFVPNGPSHANGGIDLVNNRTGESIAEMEGGEPIMVLNKDLYSNNKPLIDMLLAASLSGKNRPLMPNFPLIQKSLQTAKMQTGGITNLQGFQNLAGLNTQNPQGFQNTAALEAALHTLIQTIQDKQNEPVKAFTVLSEFQKTEKDDDWLKGLSRF